MKPRYQELAARIAARFGPTLSLVPSSCDELTYELDRKELLTVARALRDEADFSFEMLIDLCGMDYLAYGVGEWQTESASNTGFSRAAQREGGTAGAPASAVAEQRFAVVYHLLSIRHNRRLRLRVHAGTDDPPIVPSAISIWQSADWFEREAFDLFGILFEGHPDLRRILTDYGFIGHPFRKDFPVSGNVEVRYDPDRGRVVYQPVSIEPRVLVPKVVRADNRYDLNLRDGRDNG